jgi:hypothetical protein
MWLSTYIIFIEVSFELVPYGKYKSILLLGYVGDNSFDFSFFDGEINVVSEVSSYEDSVLLESNESVMICIQIVEYPS